MNCFPKSGLRSLGLYSYSQCRGDFPGFVFLSQSYFERRGSNDMTQEHGIQGQNQSEQRNKTAHVVS